MLLLHGSATFTTLDRDLFMPLVAENLLRAWRAAESLGFELTCSGRPLDHPRDLCLAEQFLRNRALTRAAIDMHILVGFTLVMAGFEFEPVWRERRTLAVDDTPVHVARMTHIVTSMALAGRPKDHLFIATHKEALEELLRSDGSNGAGFDRTQAAPRG